MKRNHGQNEELPPHAGEAEGALLGCILLAAADGGEGRKVWELVDGRIGQEVAAFFILANREVFLAMRGLVSEGMGLDVVLLTQRLRDSGKLEGCGGAGYVSGLPELAPAASMAGEYLALVWNKYLARRMIQGGIELASGLQALGGFNDGVVARFVERVEGLRRAAAKVEGSRPERLKQVSDYGEELDALWFGGARGEPGMALPGEMFGGFPLRTRGSELTFVLGEKGNGKSTQVQYRVLHCAAAGALGVIASFETPVPVTIKMLTRQLLGVRDLPENDWGRKEKARAEGWLQKRFWFFDFLGIGNWQELLEVLDYAGRYLAPEDRKDQTPRIVVSVDSVMRLGIMDDDYAQQGQAGMAFANWCNRWKGHCFLVNHLNKSEGSAKQRSRGSQQWIDNAHNVESVEANDRKGLQLAEAKLRFETGKLTSPEYEEKARELGLFQDGKWTLHNQRWPGSRQNGSVYLWYDTEGGLQYFKYPNQKAVNWLERWKGKKEKELIG